MFETLITISLGFVAVIGAIQLLLGVIGTNIYDVRAIKQQRYYDRHPHTRRYRARPLISVIVVAHNDESVVTRCLDALLKSFYRNVEIILVDNASQDTTKHLITEYAAAHPEIGIRLFAKRVAARPSDAALAAYKKYGNGELVMLLEATQTLDKRALTRAVRYLNADDTIGVLKPKLSITSTYSALGVLQKYQLLLSQRSQKLNSILGTGVERPGSGLYRREFFVARRRGCGSHSAKPGNPQSGRSYYAGDVVVYTDSPRSLEQLLVRKYQMVAAQLEAFTTQCRMCVTRRAGYRDFVGWLRLLLAACTGVAALLIPILLGYFLYMSIVLQEPTFLLVSGALLSLLLIFAIWDDAQLKFHQKLTYTLGIPLTYGLYCLIALVQASAIIATTLTPQKY